MFSCELVPSLTPFFKGFSHPFSAARSSPRPFGWGCPKNERSWSGLEILNSYGPKLLPSADGDAPEVSAIVPGVRESPMSVHSKVEPTQSTDHRRVLMAGVLVTPAGNQRVTIRDLSRT